MKTRMDDRGGGIPFLLLILLEVMSMAPYRVAANLPTFDEDSRMRILLLPATTRVGSIIYRLRASDPEFDYPLQFNVNSRSGEDLLALESVPCMRQHSICEANVVLKQPLQANRIYELNLSVRDTAGGVTTVVSTIRVTNTSAYLSDTFDHLNQYINVLENTTRETVIDYLIVRKNPTNNRGIRLELKGSNHFRLADKLAKRDQTNCSIILDRSLDFEIQSVHILRILALNAYTNSTVDTRNIVEVQIFIFVVDVQDTPPIFSMAPPVTTISDTLQPGNLVLRVKAEDGDRGSPREVRYAILAKSSQFAPFFTMDASSGSLTVRKNLKELNSMVQSNTPFLLSLVAEEIGARPGENNTSTAVDIAIIVQDQTNDPPEFNQKSYVAHLSENAPVGTALYFGDGQLPQVTDHDQGQDGIFSLSLIGDNATFEISPPVAENTANFVIRVKNPTHINFEKTRQMRFKVVAKEVQQAGRATTADVTVHINDENDNAPVFERDKYTAEIPENSKAGTPVIQVKATDSDSKTFGMVRYTNIFGEYAKAFVLDPVTGWITVGSGNMLDRETSPEMTLIVEAKDTEGTGRITTVPLLVRLRDENDNAPRFIGTPYEASLTPDLSRFTSRLRVQAVDNDTSPLNGAVRYEIVKGNYESKFYINESTGEITLRSPLTAENLPPVISLVVGAYDLGVPHQHDETTVDIYTREVAARSIYFIVPKGVHQLEMDRKKTEALLSTLTGAPTTINQIQTYSGTDYFVNEEDSKSGEQNDDPASKKSRVVATVRFPPHAAVVDLDRIRTAIATDFESPEIIAIERYQYNNSVLVWVVVFLSLILGALIVTLIICCYCPGCYLYRARGKPVEGLIAYAGNNGGISSQLTTPGRKEAWSGSKRNSVIISQRGPASLGGLAPIRTRRSDADLMDIQPEDSASQGDSTVHYQRMGKADVLRIEPGHARFSHHHIPPVVRRSNSEPRLNESHMERPDRRESTQSMVNFPQRHDSTVAGPSRTLSDISRSTLHRTPNKYVQSPILEETESALERELLTSSGYHVRQPLRKDSMEMGPKKAWQSSTLSSAPVRTIARPLPLERELPYFTNRTSVLRHRSNLSRNSQTHRHSKTTRSDTAEETESSSNNDRSQRNSRRSSTANNGLKRASVVAEDDLDSGIALNTSTRHKFTEKKSIFTIAYDGVATAQIPTVSETLPQS